MIDASLEYVEWQKNDPSLRMWPRDFVAHELSIKVTMPAIGPLFEDPLSDVAEDLKKLHEVFNGNFRWDTTTRERLQWSCPAEELKFRQSFRSVRWIVEGTDSAARVKLIEQAVECLSPLRGRLAVWRDAPYVGFCETVDGKDFYTSLSARFKTFVGRLHG